MKIDPVHFGEAMEGLLKTARMITDDDGKIVFKRGTYESAAEAVAKFLSDAAGEKIGIPAEMFATITR